MSSNRRRKIKERARTRRMDEILRGIDLIVQQDLGRDSMFGSVMRCFGERVRVICRNTETAYVEYLTGPHTGSLRWVSIASLKRVRNDNEH